MITDLLPDGSGMMFLSPTSLPLLPFNRMVWPRNEWPKFVGCFPRERALLSSPCPTLFLYTSHSVKATCSFTGQPFAILFVQAIR